MRIFKKIVITGGHLTPALATIEELKSKGVWKIYYFGRRFSLEGEKIPSEESEIISQLGVKFISINPGRLQRKFTLHTIPSLLRIPFGFFQAFILLARIRPDVILSFGSYVSTPVVIAGWFLKIQVITHEQTVTLGLANKINSYFASKIAVSYKENLSNFPSGKAVFTGNPLRKEIFIAKSDSLTREIALKKRKLGLPIIYITGGNLGAKIINLNVAAILPVLLKKFLIIHQTGKFDYPVIANVAEGLKESEKERYFFRSFISSDEIGWILANSDLVISRSGANITYELGVLGKPVIFIPLPIAGGNEQLKNAQMLRGFGLAEILPQQVLSPESLLKLIEKMVFNLKRYQKSKFAGKVFHRNGAKNLVKEIDELLTKKGK